MPNRGLTGNQLKIIAAISMTLDHIGLLLLPQLPFFRIMGRLAFPIFAYMIAEGCRYTRSRARYFLGIFGLGLVCQVVYYLFDKSLYMYTLITFSLSIPVIYALQEVKKALASPGAFLKRVLTCLMFMASVVGVYVINQHLTIDYGFWGVMVPVFASLFHQPGRDAHTIPQVLDHLLIHLLALAIALVFLTWSMGSVIQYFSLLSIPILLCYKGVRGKWRMKYFFYLFYPLHLAAIQGVYMLLR